MLASSWDRQRLGAVYLVERCEDGERTLDVIFTDRTALQAVRFRSFLDDCRRLERPATEMQPHIEAEKAVLSALLHDNIAIDAVLNEVKPEDFYHPSHQQLFTSMLALQDANEPVDLLTLANHLNEQKLLDSVGGHVYLAELFDYEATAANVVQHARIVRDKSVKRGLIHVASEIVNLGYDESEPSDKLLDEAESRIFALSQERAKSALSPLDKEVHDAIDHIEESAGQKTHSSKPMGTIR